MKIVKVDIPWLSVFASEVTELDNPLFQIDAVSNYPVHADD